MMVTLDADYRNMEFIPMILGSSINGYGVLRSFSEKGMRALVIDSVRGPAFHSRFAKAFLCEDCNDSDESLLRLLNEIGDAFDELGCKGILYPTSDTYLFFIGRNEAVLRHRFLIAMSEWQSVLDCTNKTLMYQKAEEQNVPIPKTFVCQSTDEIRAKRGEFPFPLLIKPVVTIGFTEKLGLGKKAVIVGSDQELEQLLVRMDEHDLSRTELILQEVIEGSAEQLYTISTYSGADGKIYAYSIGHKLRQTPPDAGTIRAGQVIAVDGLYEMTDRLLQGMKFSGIANTEYKYDAKTDTYKLIEINPRPGLWNYSATAAGVNLPYLCYLDVTGQWQDPIPVHSDRVLTWYIDFRDYFEAVHKNKRNGFSQYAITKKQWQASLGQRRVRTLYNAKDPMPAVAFLLSNFTAFFRGRKR